MKHYWIVKQEPDSYSWDAFARDKTKAWTGVRNFQARNNLRTMKKGDIVLYYHSGDAKEIVALCSVARENYPDPTAREGSWSAVDLKAGKRLKKTVPLAALKADPLLSGIQLVRNSRLSVSVLTEDEFNRIMELSATPDL